MGIEVAAASLIAPHVLDLIKAVTSAKSRHDQRLARRGPETLEARRTELVARVSDLQTQAILLVKDQALLERIVPILLSQTAAIYEAITDEDIAGVDLLLKRVQGAIEQYRQRMRSRALARQAAMLVSLLLVAALIALTAMASRLGLSTETTIPMLALPLPVVLWSAIGSFAAILYRFNQSDIELRDPLRWLFTRPLTGMVLGSVTYLVVRTGLLTMNATQDSAALGKNELLWLIAFLAGFSDRFSDSLLRMLVGRFGGERDAGLVTVDDASNATVVGTVGTWLEQLSRDRKSAKARREEAEDSLPDKANGSGVNAKPMESSNNGQAGSTVPPGATSPPLRRD